MNQSDVSEIDGTSQTELENTRQQISEQLSQTHEQLKEIGLLLEQSELEVNKLTQRNAETTGTLKRVQSQFERLPREEIRSAYDAALDAQQRLFVVRGQVEKLQSDQTHLQNQIVLLEMLMGLLPEETSAEDQLGSASSTIELLEMSVQAQETERQRLSRRMHDGPAQALSNLILETEIAMRLFDLDKEKAYEELGTLRNSATKTFQQVRDFIFELRPMMLDDLGLIPTLKKYTSAIEEQSDITIQFGVTGLERRMESYLEVMIFRAIQELVRNALIHSQANRIDVQLDIGDTFVRINVEDNGVGFDVDSLENEKGMGLKLIRERVDMTGGNFEIDSRIGEGTRISIRVPESVLGEHDSNLSQT